MSGRERGKAPTEGIRPVGLDRIHIRDLLLRCRIGVEEEERAKRQDVVLNLVIHADLSAGARSDRIEETISYRTLKKAIIAALDEDSFHLLEHLAERVAEVCLAAEGVVRVEVVADKPGALRFARSVAVEIVREKGDGRADPPPQER